ncbi:MAG: tRNA uridine-5-carboxymethylaminomethyl(34) synthesis GTPase MnmE [Candidatus Omnitrophica bacterium]|nr:tRNA uridine-5-carboxymethylaminomethyl(34) synthesis GTPase MnmE [Candidatus Omnitrophota bacterium]MDD5488706.1 tRNA uridine-5-carboxymethylaminomethyl(34) synthesis GTPase MnmE [Candidatus Omnitrophota bacterium]
MRRRGIGTVDGDTIAAISTPIGSGGIGIVRISGKDALLVADRLFHGPAGSKLSSVPSHSVRYGHIRCPKSGHIVDEVLAVVMRAPRSYTTEDVVEINCHGGKAPLKKVLELCMSNGARLAEPGEFTKRAFLNGRLDLSQAEAVLDVIQSETEISGKIALEHMSGGFSGEINRIRDRILDIISKIELTLDFSAEDVEFPETSGISGEIKQVKSDIGGMLDTADKGMILRHGASVVICGRPNVGKSSLMNALLRHDRVIVTPIAGTTRDVVEESIEIAGVKTRISDTAGIMDTKDRVELEGIKRSMEKLVSSDMVVFMLDMSRPLDEKDMEIFDRIKEKNMVIAANKCDLPPALDTGKAEKAFGRGILRVSVLCRTGLEALEDAIAEALAGPGQDTTGARMVTNIRHKQSLESAYSCLERAVGHSGEGYNGELVSSDLNDVLYHLGMITGETADDEVLDRIFSSFCIGK